MTTKDERRLIKKYVNILNSPIVVGAIWSEKTEAKRKADVVFMTKKEQIEKRARRLAANEAELRRQNMIKKIGVTGTKIVYWLRKLGSCLVFFMIHIFIVSILCIAGVMAENLAKIIGFFFG